MKKIVSILSVVCIGFMVFALYQKNITVKFFESIDNGNEIEVANMIEHHPELVNVCRSIDSKIWQTEFDYFDGAVYPLERACEVGRFEIAKILIEHGANINGKGARTPLEIVCSKKDEGWNSMAIYLIENGADVNDVAALKAMIVENDDDNVTTDQVILYVVDANLVEYNNWKYVYLSCAEKGRIDIMQKIQTQKLIEKKDMNEVLRYLVEIPNEVQMVEWYGTNITKEAIMKKRSYYLDSIRYLLENGVDVEAEFEGKTIRDWAAQYGDDEVLAIFEGLYTLGV